MAKINRFKPLGLLVGSALVLAGCTGLPAVPPAGTQFDGSYVGQDSLVSGVPFQCGAPMLPERIDVREGRFDYPFQVSPPRVAPLAVQVAADGTVNGQMQYAIQQDSPLQPRLLTDWVRLSGQITGGTLDATITYLRCARRLIAQLR